MKNLKFLICVGLFSLVTSLENTAFEGGSATCYSTYQSGGTTTIWRCGSCQSITNAQNPTDSGKCRANQF